MSVGLDECGLRGVQRHLRIHAVSWVHVFADDKIQEIALVHEPMNVYAGQDGNIQVESGRSRAP